jgi:hypothetical protein
MNYQNLTVVQLKKICDTHNIPYKKTIRKNDLITILTNTMMDNSDDVVDYDVDMDNNMDIDMDNNTIIYIRTLTGNIYDFNININASVSDLKSIISHKINVPTNKLNLRILLNDVNKQIGDIVYQNGSISRLMNDNESLLQYNIVINKFFELSIRFF